jgi:hypothetical protein
VAFSYNNYVEHLGAGAVQNPTRTDAVNPSLALAGPQVDAVNTLPDPVAPGKVTSSTNAKWQINANGLYQFPMG